MMSNLLSHPADNTQAVVPVQGNAVTGWCIWLQSATIHWHQSLTLALTWNINCFVKCNAYRNYQGYHAKRRLWRTLQRTPGYESRSRWFPEFNQFFIILRSISGNTFVKANSAFHPSRVGDWVPGSAGKAKAGMVCDQSPRSTQPGHPFVGRHNEYQPKCDECLAAGE